MIKESIIIKENAEVQAHFEDLDGNILQFEELTCELAKSYGAYLLIKANLNHALEMIELIIEIKDSKIKNQGIIEHSLHLASIITYGKCFVRANGRKVKLEESLVFKDNELYQAIHTQVVNLRHHYVAHAGNNLNEKAHVFEIKGHKQDSIDVIKGYTVSETRSSNEELENTADLIIFTLRFVRKKIDKLHSQLVTKYG